jgi:PAS domain S-box-containing protein
MAGTPAFEYAPPIDANRAGEAPPRKNHLAFSRRFTAAFTRCVLGAAVLFGASNLNAQQPVYEAKNGVLDLRGVDLAHDLVELRGDWMLYRDRFIDPTPTDAQAGGVPIAVPGNWNRAGGAEGFGTYTLDILCTAAADQAIRFPAERTALRFYVNGREVAHQGNPGISPETAQAVKVGRLATLGNQSCPLKIVAHVSNYNHRQGGLVRAIELGPEQLVRARQERAFAFGVTLFTGFLIMALLPLLFVITRPRERPPLWFGLFCLSLALFMALAREGVVLLAFSEPRWEPFLKAEYLSWYWGTVLFLLFMRSMYPAELKAGVVKAFVACGIAMAAFVVLAPGRIYTHGLPAFQAIAVLTGLYITYAMAIAVRNGRHGARIMLAAITILVCAEMADFLQSGEPLRTLALPFASLLFALAPAAVLIGRYGRALNREEERLFEQRQRTDMLVRATKAGFLDWDAEAGTTVYSDRFKEMLGYAPETDPSVWGDYFSLVHPEDVGYLRTRFMEQLRDTGEPNAQRNMQPHDFRMLRADGSTVWVHAEAILLTGPDGRTLRHVCSFIDITGVKRHEEEMSVQLEERSAAEQALITEQRRFGLVVRAAKVGIVDWDGKTHATYYSPHFREIRGYAPDTDTSDWPDYFKVMIHPDDRARVSKRFRDYIMGKGPDGPLEFYEREEYRLSRADGSYVWVQIMGVCTRDDAGFATRFIAAVTDITERRAQEEATRASRDQIAAQAAQLERQNEALQESVRLREEVERIARHDLKTPLNSIVAAARLLREERTPTESEAELLDVVERAGYRVLSMVNLSFDIFRMERGEYRFQPQAVDLSRLIGRISADLRIHAVSKGVALRLPEAATPAYAWADELLCYSILANLLKNAIEASPDSTAVTVSLREDGPQLVLEIHNPGEVPAGVRGHFFEKYSSSGKSGGLGLGTYSARLLARVQEGDISMRTSAREGTTLEIRLRALPYGMQPPAAGEGEVRGDAPSAPAAALPPLNVLVVDDDEYNLLVMRRYLPSPPLRVRTEANGRAAIDAVAEDAPDVIFMDIEMPVMDGYEAVERIRGRERTQGLRRTAIIAFSSHDDEESKRRALAAGCDVYLRKPAARDAVHAVLLNVSGHGTHAAAAASAPAEPLAAGPADDVLVDADMRDTVPEFLRTRRLVIGQMGEALRSGDPALLRRLAHKLSGSFSLYGFRWASDQCRAIEHATAGPAAFFGQIEALTHHLDNVRIRYGEVAPGRP